MSEISISLKNQLNELEKSLDKIQNKYLKESETYRTVMIKKARLENIHKNVHSKLYQINNNTEKEKENDKQNKFITILTRESNILPEEYKDHSFYSYGKELKVLKSTVIEFPFYNELRSEIEKESESNSGVVFLDYERCEVEVFLDMMRNYFYEKSKKPNSKIEVYVSNQMNQEKFKTELNVFFFFDKNYWHSKNSENSDKYYSLSVENSKNGNRKDFYDDFDFIYED